MKSNTLRSRRVFIIDDNIALLGIETVVSEMRNVQIVGSATSFAEAMDKIVKLTPPPDLVITELTLGSVTNIKHLENLTCLKMPVLVLSGSCESVYALRTMRVGASGFIQKTTSVDEIRNGIKLALEGKNVYSAEITSQIINQFKKGEDIRKSPIQKLSDRELEVYNMIGNGQATREIAQALHVSPKTVESHRAHIKEKLELKTGASLIANAIAFVSGQLK